MVPRTLAVVLIGALAVKAIVLAQLHGHPLLQPVGTLDSAVYVDLGRRVASGDLALGPEPYFVAPLYIYFLGLVFFVSGGSLLAAKCAQIVLGALAVGLIYATARHWFGERTAWIAAALATATGVFTFHEVVLLQAALDPFLTALALFLLARALALRRGRAFLGAGLAFGLLALNRPNALACAATVLVLLPLARRSKAGVVLALAFAAGVALALAPVTLRNYAVAGEPMLVSSHGGLNFYIGNNARADGTYHRVPGITPDIVGQARDARSVAERAVGRPLSVGGVSGYFYRQAWKWISDHPAQAAGLFLRKVAYVVNDVELALNYSYAYYSRDEPTLLRFLVVGPWLLVPLGIVGLADRLRTGPPPGLEAGGQRDGFALWAAFVPAYAVSIAVFFVSSRYRLPLLVPLCVGGALTLDRVLRAVQERRPRPLVAYALALAPLALLASWRSGLDDGRSEERTAMVEYLIDNGRSAEALALLPRVEAGHPRPALLSLRVGRALLEAGRAAEAIPRLRSALEAGAPPDLAAFDLARALAAVGSREEAVAALRRIPDADTMDPASFLAAGKLALELQAPDLAERFLAPAARLAPDSAEVHESLGVALALQGRRDEAVAALEAACRLDPGNASVQLNLAVALADVGRIAEARTRAAEALRLRPDYPQARGLLEALGHRP